MLVLSLMEPSFERCELFTLSAPGNEKTSCILPQTFEYPQIAFSRADEDFRRLVTHNGRLHGSGNGRPQILGSLGGHSMVIGENWLLRGYQPKLGGQNVDSQPAVPG